MGCPKAGSVWGGGGRFCRSRLRGTLNFDHPWKPGSPRFPLKGSFKGDMDNDIDTDTDIDIEPMAPKVRTPQL